MACGRAKPPSAAGGSREPRHLVKVQSIHDFSLEIEDKAQNWARQFDVGLSRITILR